MKFSKLCFLTVGELPLAQIKFNIDKCYTTRKKGKDILGSDFCDSTTRRRLNEMSAACLKRDSLIKLLRIQLMVTKGL